MAEEQFFLPESRYQQTYLNHWEDNPNHYIGEIVHVLPIEFIQQENVLRVRGKNFDGIIKVQELSIYPIICFEESHIPKFIPHLFGHCITAAITDFYNGQFIMSRKITMQKALEHIEIGNILEAKKIAIQSNTTFLDIGAGINAIIPIHEVSASFIRNVNLTFMDMEYIPVKIICESPNYKHKFVASFKQAYVSRPISKGDIVIGKAINLLKDNSGVFVEISPNQVGIADTDYLIVSGSSELDECLHPDIILGNSYSFLVQKFRGYDNGVFRYSLRLL